VALHFIIEIQRITNYQIAILKSLDTGFRGCVAIIFKCKFVILNPSQIVILSVAKNLAVWLRINSVKNLIRSICYKTGILRPGPQNDIVTQPLDRVSVIN
jgi:hypothetical protein